MCRILFLLMLLVGNSLLSAEPVPVDVTLELPTFVVPGKQTVFTLRFDHAIGTHTYAPGEEGAITVEWRLPDGWEIAPLKWPVPLNFEFQGVKSRGFTGVVTLRVPVKVPMSEPLNKKFTVAAKVTWVACGESQCVPGSRLFIDQVGTQMLALTNPVKESAWRDLTLAGNSDIGKEIYTWEERFRAMNAPHPAFMILLWAAFLGGIILNLMPCVFPVLGIKVMSFVAREKECVIWGRKDATMAAAGVYALGIILSLVVLGSVVLALRAGGEAIGWGFQLQEAGFVWTIGLLMGILAMNLAGGFEMNAIGGSFLSKLAGDHGCWGAFGSGVLMVLVATPCSAPFLGVALAGIFLLPVWQALLVLVVMGVGLALPYVVLAAFPAIVQKLPKPGAWMDDLKKILAWLMGASAVYMAWVYLGQVAPLPGLMGLLSAAAVLFGLWMTTRWTKVGRQAGIFFVLIGLLPGVVGFVQKHFAPQRVEIRWQAWSDEKATHLREKNENVVVEFTARWCVTCLVNERVWEDKRVIDILEKRNVTLLRADWTNRDAQIAAALAKHGRTAVPLVVIYKSNGEIHELPDLLKAEDILKAFKN